MWKSPEALAGEMYHWAYNCDEPLGTVFTIYELHSGEDYKDSGFIFIYVLILQRFIYKK
jgi:hypothetical protein